MKSARDTSHQRYTPPNVTPKGSGHAKLVGFAAQFLPKSMDISKYGYGSPFPSLKGDVSRHSKEV